MNEFVYVSSKELGSCPAAVNMYDGKIEINKSVWDRFSEFEKRFIIEHERGHFKLQTNSETEADAYAIHRVYKTSPQSLKKSISTLYKVGILDDARLKSLYIEALKIDAISNNNEKALQELSKLNKNMKIKQTTGGSPFMIRAKMTGKKKQRYMDEDSVPQPAEESKKEKIVCQSKRHKQNGLVIGDYYLSFTNIILIAIFIMLICVKNKF